MVKKIKKHLKKQYVKPVNLTEEEKEVLNAELQHAAALTHVLGEAMAKHLKKKFPKGAPEDSKEIFKNDAYAQFLNDTQLMLINGFGLSAEDVINCNMDLLPAKLTKLNVAGDTKKAAKSTATTMLCAVDVLHGIANAFKEQQDAVEQINGLCSQLEDSVNWLCATFKVSAEEESDK